MDKKYIVLYGNENGEKSIYLMTEQEIKDDFLNEDTCPNISLKFPEDLGCWAGLLIIDGEIVIPEPIEKVIDWKL